MSSAIEAGLMPDNTASSGHEVWWYQLAGQSCGPVSEAAIRDLLAQKVVDRSTLLWREDFGEQWRRYDETALWRSQPAPPPPPVRPTYNLKWQKVFDAAAYEAESWSILNRNGIRRTSAEQIKASRLLYSIPGFFFGPFYYFYLRMWRKGVLLLAMLPLVSLVEDLTVSSRWFNFIIPVVCATMAKRDYYRFCVKGESIWPFLRFSKNIFTDIAIVIVITAMAIVADIGLSAPSIRVPTVSSSNRSEDSVRALLSIGKRPDGANGIYTLTITSRSASVQVRGIKVNRGTCQATLYEQPVTLRFGETVDVTAICNPIEAEVYTNAGAATFSWVR